MKIRPFEWNRQSCPSLSVFHGLPPLSVFGQLDGRISLELYRPAIILPREMTLALDVSQRRDILIHETVHIHRRDDLVVLL